MKIKKIFINIFLILTILFLLATILINSNTLDIVLKGVFLESFFDFIIYKSSDIGFTVSDAEIVGFEIYYVSNLIQHIPTILFLGYAVTTYLIYEALNNDKKIVSKIVLAFLVYILVYIKTIYDTVIGTTVDAFLFMKIIENAFLSFSSSIMPVPGYDAITSIVSFSKVVNLLPIVFDISVISLIITLVVKSIRSIKENKSTKAISILLGIWIVTSFIYVFLSPYVLGLFNSMLKPYMLNGIVSLFVSLISIIVAAIFIITMIIRILIKAKGVKKWFAMIPIYLCYNGISLMILFPLLTIFTWLFGIIIFQ